MVMLSSRLGQWVRRLFQAKAPLTSAQKRLAQLDAWENLCRTEPRLEELELEILASTPPRRMPEFWRHWRRHWKLRVAHLAGWTADSPTLRTREAYDVTTHALWSAYETSAELTHEENEAVGASTNKEEAGS